MHRALRAALLQERAGLCAGTLACAGSGRRNHRARDVRVVAHRRRRRAQNPHDDLRAHQHPPRLQAQGIRENIARPFHANCRRDGRGLPPDLREHRVLRQERLCSREHQGNPLRRRPRQRRALLPLQRTAGRVLRRNHRQLPRPRTVLCRHAQSRGVREVRRGIPAEGKTRAARAARVKRTCVGEGPPLAPATCHPRVSGELIK